MPANATRRALLLGFLVVAALPLFAGGQAEDPIRLARELVSENRINEAILLLEETVRTDPERIREAEALLRSIREIRGEYNVLFEELIDTLVNDPDNIERTLELIDAMEELDEFPNQRVVEQVEDARLVAQLAFDRNLFNEAMDEAADLLNRGETVAALERYISVSTLQRGVFDDRGYGSIFVSSVERTLQRLRSVPRSTAAVIDPSEEARDALVAAIDADLGAVPVSAVNTYVDQARQIDALLVTVNELAQEIAVLRSQVALQFPDETVDWFLVFQDYIVRGRSDRRGEEGFERAIADLFARTVEPVRTAAADAFARNVTLADGALEDENWTAAASAYDAIVANAQTVERLARAAARAFDSPAAWNDGIGQLDDVSAGIVRRVAIDRTRAVALADFARASSVFEAGQRTASTDSIGKERAAAAVVAVAAAEARWSADRSALEAALSDVVPDGTVAALDAVDRRFETLRTAVIATERERTASIIEAQIAGSEVEYTRLAQEADAILPLLDGIAEQISGDEEAETVTARVIRYPDDALERSQRARAAVVAQREIVDVGAQIVAEEPAYVTEGPAIAALGARIAGLTDEAERLIARFDEQERRAIGLISGADVARERAENQIADARAAIAAGLLEPARNEWNAARESYLESLELREDPNLRELSDEVIQQVGLELRELENIIVVREVRELLTQADDLYARDEYTAARDVLNQASSVWAQTNVDPNVEIDRLTRLVNAALSLAEGRDLEVTDPLYPILGNYLSLALEDYANAVDAVERGDQEAADILFDRAIENLRNVRDVRPLNWDARILELRIARDRAADEFDQVFAARYEQAVERIDEIGPLQAYSELEALAEINPDYPGLQNQLVRLERQLNLRPVVVDQTNIREASQLVDRAEGLAAGGSRDQIVVAVSLLEEAIELNPRDGDAKFLLDQLRIQIGGQATVALTSADEEQYRRAETLFSQGRALQALSIVERLLVSETNQTYPPLVDLRRRIALRLGI